MEKTKNNLNKLSKPECRPAQKVWLNEVSFMRPILLVLLVSYHAFAPYISSLKSWPLPEGFHQVEVYDWIGLLSRAFRLEGFVFISGYIFTFQLVEKKKFSSLKSLFTSKFQRLLIPSFIFSTLYILFFLHGLSPFSTVLNIIGGAAHLWYLPCLFWCFLFQYIVIEKDFSPKLILIVLVIAMAISCVHLPFQINKVFYYISFFYGGGIFWTFSKWFDNKGSIKNIFMAWAIFAILFVVINLLIIHLNSVSSTQKLSIVLKGGMLLAKTYSKAILGWSGIIALYLTSVYYCKKHILSDIIIKIGACGYGVYVFHQFILVYLYRYTEFPQICGTYGLPWAGFGVTVIFSVLLTLAVRSTKIGRRYL